jgi:hypothetical protein
MQENLNISANLKPKSRTGQAVNLGLRRILLAKPVENKTKIAWRGLRS